MPFKRNETVHKPAPIPVGSRSKKLEDRNNTKPANQTPSSGSRTEPNNPHQYGDERKPEGTLNPYKTDDAPDKD